MNFKSELFDYVKAQHYDRRDSCRLQFAHRVHRLVVSTVGDEVDETGALQTLWQAGTARYETMIFVSSRDRQCLGECCPAGAHAVLDKEGREEARFYWESAEEAERMHSFILRKVIGWTLAKKLYLRLERKRLQLSTFLEMLKEEVSAECDDE